MEFIETFEEFQCADVNLMWNVTPIVDCMTARWVMGTRDDWILVGGYSNNGGLVAPANAGKTALILLMWTRFLKRIPCSLGQLMESEGTLDIERTNETFEMDAYDTDGFIRKIPTIEELEDAKESGEYIDTSIQFVDGTSLTFDTYIDMLHVQAKARHKLKGIKKYQYTLPFKYHRKYLDKIIAPIAIAVDSATEALIDSAEGRIEKNGVDNSKTNMLDMDAGKVKTRIFQRLGALATLGNMFLFSTASLDKTADMSTMPGMSPPKEMTHMKGGDAIKGVGRSYKKRTAVLFAMNKAATLTKGTGSAEKTPKFPKNKADNWNGNQDLQINILTAYRNKTGPSGWVIPLIRSQDDGLVESATFFLTLQKLGTDDRAPMYGLHVPKQHHFALDLMPEVHFRLTTLRETADNNKLFSRALELTYRLKMMFHINPVKKFAYMQCTPKELYDGIIEKGYKWEVLLNTRSWFTVLEEEHRFRPQLTEPDFIRMWKEDYIPHWMKPSGE